jgi:hypothetical protein
MIHAEMLNWISGFFCGVGVMLCVIAAVKRNKETEIKKLRENKEKDTRLFNEIHTD